MSNPGQVWCGDKWCKAHVETCCGSGNGTACLPTASLEDGWCPDSDFAQASCDETTDCPEGLVCCGFEGSQGLSFHSCSKAPCGWAEGCLVDDGCRPDFACQRDTPDTIGDCVYTKAHVRCGKQTCSGEKSACRWSSEGGECVVPGEGTLGCTRDDECAPGYRCCYGFTSSYCAGSCGSHAAPLCKTKKDCPPKASLQPTGCEPTGYPGMRYCAY